MGTETLLNYFDRIFCINLDRRPDRWTEAQAELRLCGIEGCERLAAILLPNCTDGCTASHRAIWRRIAAGECGERVLVFEDDFMFVTRAELVRVGFQERDATLKIFDSCPGTTFLERFSEMLPSVPDRWDLLYLGGGYESPPWGRVNRHVIRNAGMLTTHAYAIGRRFAAELTERLDKEFPPPAIVIGAPDSLLALRVKDPRVLSYTLTPRLFIQRPTTMSDLNPQPTGGFPWSMTDAAHEVTAT